MYTPAHVRIRSLCNGLVGRSATTTIVVVSQHHIRNTLQATQTLRRIGTNSRRPEERATLTRTFFLPNTNMTQMLYIYHIYMYTR